MKLTIVIQVFLFNCMIYLFSCTVTGTVSEGTMNNQINLQINMAELKIKHKPEKPRASTMKQNNMDRGPLPSIHDEPTSSVSKINRQSGLGKDTDIIDLAKEGSSSGMGSGRALQIGVGPVYYEGWIKYISYNRKNTFAPKNFFKNNEFYEQQKYFPKADADSKSKSSKGQATPDLIKGPTYFYAMLFQESVNFLSSLHKEIQKTYDILAIKDILETTEDPGFGAEARNDNTPNTNGIQDYGNFAEGYCFKILTMQKVWIICTDTQEEKDTFMIKVNDLKIMQQREKGIYKVKPRPEDKDNGTVMKLMYPDPENISSKDQLDKKSIDGYWIVLQDWSQCSLKCGGGESTFHRLCIPPRNGGKPCEGEGILKKPCNTQACPKFKGLQENNRTREVNLAPIVKVLPFSSRPQRYTKCVVKESDLMYTQQADTKNQNNPDINFSSNSGVTSLQIPTRVVMNNQTFSIFGGETYTSLIASYNMEFATFAKSKKPSCFFIKEGERSSELCPFGFERNDKTYQEWNYQFNLFKYQCRTPKTKVNKKLEEEFNQKLAQKMEEAKALMLQERENEIKKKAIDTENKDLNSIVQHTNEVALQAIEKELSIEAMIRQEEYEREQKEEEAMLIKIEAEKKKSDCLMKAIKERQIENQYNLRTEQTKKEIAEIKKTATDQVLIKRNSLKNQIQKMRNQAKRRQEQLMSQLQAVRSTMAAQMSNAYKKGDDSKCRMAMRSDETRKNYCVANFPESFTSYSTCMGERDEFCRICCENEFGDMFQSDRTKCYNMVCKSAESEITKQSKGRWVFQVSQ